MHQPNHNHPDKTAPNPNASLAGRAYLAVLAAGWVFVVGMALGGPWAVGTQVESRLEVVPLATDAEEAAAAAKQLKPLLELALAGALGADPAPGLAASQEPRSWPLHWQHLSLNQQRELIRHLGLSAPPNRFQVFWHGQQQRPQLVVRMVLPDPAEAPARLQDLLHRIGNQAMAAYRRKLFRQLATVRNQAREHWQALLQTDDRFQQWLQEVLGPQATVTPVAYWQRIPSQTEDSAKALVLPPATSGPQSALPASPTPEPDSSASSTAWAELTIQQLRRRVAQLEAQDEELAARLTQQHPQRQQVQATLRRLRVYLARRLKQAGEQFQPAPPEQQANSSQARNQAQEQLARLLQQHARKLQQFRQELDRLSRAYLETVERESRLWQRYQQLESRPPLRVTPPQFRPVWLFSRRNHLALALILGGGLVAVAMVRWHRWSQDTFTSVEEMHQALGQRVVAAAPWRYEASCPPRKRWRQRLQRLQRLLEWSLLGLAATWAGLGLLHADFRGQWVQDPLLAIACTWRYLAGG